MKIIPSEDQAEAVGEKVTGGKRDRDFTVFQYELRPERITAFGVKLKTGQLVTRFNP